MQKDQANAENVVPTSNLRGGNVNDAGSIHVSGYVKVFDPNTQEILLEARE